MKVYCISYDLKGTNRDYSALISALQKMGRWWHFLESTWLIATNETSAEIWKQLSSTIDKTDRLLIIEVRKNVQGWLPQEAWDWINTNVPQS